MCTCKIVVSFLTHDGVICSINVFPNRDPLPTIKSSVDTVCEGTITKVLCWRVPDHKYGVVRYDHQTDICWWRRRYCGVCVYAVGKYMSFDCGSIGCEDVMFSYQDKVIKEILYR